MDQTPIRLNFTPLSFRDLAEKYSNQEKMRSMRTMAIVVTLVFTIGTGILGFVFRDKILMDQESTVLGAQSEDAAKQQSGAQGNLYLPNADIPEDTKNVGRLFKDEFFIFKIPMGWAAREFSSDLLPSLLKLVEMQPTNELAIVGEDGKQVRSSISLSILKQGNAPEEASGEAEMGDLEVDGIAAEVRTEKNTMLFANVLNQRFEAQLITVTFPLKDNMVTIVYKLFAQSGEVKQKRTDFFNFVKSIDLVGVEPKPTVTPTPEPTIEAESGEEPVEEAIVDEETGEPLELRNAQSEDDLPQATPTPEVEL